MKHKRLIFLLVLVYCLWLPSAIAQQYTASGHFTIAYDSGVYTLDDITYESENQHDDSHWFFILYNDEIMFDVSMDQFEDYRELNLLTADSAAKEQYVADVLDFYSDEEAALVLALAAGPQKIPFYVYSMQNEDGPYLMAETVQSGCAIDFMAYYNDASLPVDDVLIEKLTALLNTFEPVK